MKNNEEFEILPERETLKKPMGLLGKITLVTGLFGLISGGVYVGQKAYDNYTLNNERESYIGQTLLDVVQEYVDSQPETAVIISHQDFPEFAYSIIESDSTNASSDSILFLRRCALNKTYIELPFAFSDFGKERVYIDSDLDGKIDKVYIGDERKEIEDSLPACPDLSDLVKDEPGIIADNK